MREAGSDSEGHASGNADVWRGGGQGGGRVVRGARCRPATRTHTCTRVQHERVSRARLRPCSTAAPRGSPRRVTPAPSRGAGRGWLAGWLAGWRAPSPSAAPTRTFCPAPTAWLERSQPPCPPASGSPVGHHDVMATRAPRPPATAPCARRCCYAGQGCGRSDKVEPLREQLRVTAASSDEAKTPARVPGLSPARDPPIYGQEPPTSPHGGQVGTSRHSRHCQNRARPTPTRTQG